MKKELVGRQVRAGLVWMGVSGLIVVGEMGGVMGGVRGVLEKIAQPLIRERMMVVSLGNKLVQYGKFVHKGAMRIVNLEQEKAEADLRLEELAKVKKENEFLRRSLRVVGLREEFVLGEIMYGNSDGGWVVRVRGQVERGDEVLWQKWLIGRVSWVGKELVQVKPIWKDELVVVVGEGQVKGELGRGQRGVGEVVIKDKDVQVKEGAIIKGDEGDVKGEVVGRLGKRISKEAEPEQRFLWQGLKDLQEGELVLIRRQK